MIMTERLIPGAVLVLVTGIGLLAVAESLAHGWKAPEEMYTVQNPVEPDEDSLQSGETAYRENCAACHGESLEGLKASETGLEMDTPNLKERLRGHSHGDFFWKINEGRGEMPSFKDELSDEQKWQIIHYINAEPE